MPSVVQTITKQQAKPPYFVGVDLGGTNIKVGLVDDLGRTLRKFTIPTLSPQGPEDGARRMGEAVRRVMSECGIAAAEVGHVGLGSPGTMDVPGGMLLEPFNLPGWYHFPLRDRVAHHAGLPVAFSNDANAAAYGEFWVGSGRQFHSMIMLTLGTGVGGGIIIGDLSVDGEHSHGSELGHVILDYHEDARVCPCGHSGHLEAYASATSLVKRTYEVLSDGTPSSLSERMAQGETLSALLIDQEAEKGDPLAWEVILETAMYLGVGIVTMMNTIDPDGVVLGGAMTFGGHESEVGRKFLARVREEVARRAFPVPRDRTMIDFASLGGDAGYIGAAGIGRIAFSKK